MWWTTTHSQVKTTTKLPHRWIILKIHGIEMFALCIESFQYIVACHYFPFSLLSFWVWRDHFLGERSGPFFDLPMAVSWTYCHLIHWLAVVCLWFAVFVRKYSCYQGWCYIFYFRFVFMYAKACHLNAKHLWLQCCLAWEENSMVARDMRFCRCVWQLSEISSLIPTTWYVGLAV